MVNLFWYMMHFVLAERALHCSSAQLCWGEFFHPWGSIVPGVYTNVWRFCCICKLKLSTFSTPSHASVVVYLCVNVCISSVGGGSCIIQRGCRTNGLWQKRPQDNVGAVLGFSSSMWVPLVDLDGGFMVVSPVLVFPRLAVLQIPMHCIQGRQSNWASQGSYQRWQGVHTPSNSIHIVNCKREREWIPCPFFLTCSVW